LVIHDMLGLYDDFKPKFVKRYANLKEVMLSAIVQYKNEVEQSDFPTDEYSFH
ncbi:MAG: 3-methyl-2-oxobutanoate hydroxymethyltransferase, partial [Candidatus Tectomicrobia bacterium]|nr:3-methyl-2-oxobutanoate hydroxymethyltransferase [Candidatus Tectomicrobia bacterium]